MTVREELSWVRFVVAVAVLISAAIVLFFL